MMEVEYNLPENVWHELEEERHEEPITKRLDVYSTPVDLLINSEVLYDRSYDS